MCMSAQQLMTLLGEAPDKRQSLDAIRSKAEDLLDNGIGIRRHSNGDDRSVHPTIGGLIIKVMSYRCIDAGGATIFRVRR
jgi:hypothetical protein